VVAVLATAVAAVLAADATVLAADATVLAAAVTGAVAAVLSSFLSSPQALNDSATTEPSNASLKNSS
jgi:uncharacterized membrane-anchored protein